MQVENPVDLVISYHDLLHASRKYLLLIVSVVFLSISVIASFSSSDLKKLSSLNMQMEDKWTIYVVCKGTEEGEQFHMSFSIEKSLLTLGNLTTLKSKQGYGSRDYMYCKRRSVDDPESAIL